MSLDLPSDYLDQIQAIYPKRSADQGWMKVRSQIPSLVNWGYSWDTILKGTKSYAKHCQVKKTDPDYVKRAAVFFDPKEMLFAEFAEMDTRSPLEIAMEARWIVAKDRAAVAGFRAPYPSEPVEAYETQLRGVERDKQTVGDAPLLRMIRK